MASPLDKLGTNTHINGFKVFFFSKSNPHNFVKHVHFCEIKS